MRALPLILCCALAACAPTPKGVGFGDRIGGATLAGGPAVADPDAAYRVPVQNGQTVVTETAMGPRRETVQTRTTADGRTQTVRTIEIGTPPSRPAVASNVVRVNPNSIVPVHRVSNPRIDAGRGYRVSEGTVLAIRQAGDSSVWANDAVTVPFAFEDITGELRRVNLNGFDYLVVEPVRNLPARDGRKKALAAEAAAQMAGCQSEGRGLTHHGWGAKAWIILVDC